MATVKCPHCGQKIIVSVDRPGGYHLFESSKPTTIFKQAHAAATIPQPQRHEVETPTFLPTVDSHVKVPMAQSLLSGLFAAPIPAVITSVLAYNWLDANWKGMLLAFAAGFTTTFFGVTWWQWFKRAEYFNSLLWKLETVIGSDLNSDGDTGQPQPRPAPISVEIRQGHTWQFAELPGEPQALHTLACAVLSGETFSERTATAAGYTQEEFGKLRDEFINRGLAHWNHPTRKQQGVSMGRSGRHVLQAIADSPLPQE